MFTLELLTLFVLYCIEQSAQARLFDESRYRAENIRYYKAVEDGGQYRQEREDAVEYFFNL